jgi:hypothetical protein
MRIDNISQRYFLEHERPRNLEESHEGMAGGNYAGKAIAQKVLLTELWWPMIHRDLKEYFQRCDVCQRVGKPNRREEMPLQLQVKLQEFDKWEIDFVGPIKPPAKRTGSRYITTMMEYLKIWVEDTPVKDCIAETTAHFLFEQAITRFWFPRFFMSDQGTHFINSTICTMLEEFEVHNQKNTPYNPHVNGIVEAFNKILENTLTKICNVNRDDWDLKVLAVLWVYRMTCKNLTGHTPFTLFYGHKAIVPLEFLVPSLCIAAITQMIERGAIQERLNQLLSMEEDRILAGFNQQVQKSRDKSWHDRHIKKRTFKEGDLVFLYDNKSFQHLGKLRMHWLGPYEVKSITDRGVVQLRYLVGADLRGMINGS